MKAKRIFILMCLVAMAVVSCKKETLQPGNTAGPTVFYFNGTVNGAPVSIKAGINNYYMYSSYIQDANNVYNFTGSLHQTSCTVNCPNSIQFIINDYQTTAIGAPVSNIDSSITVGTYVYLSPSGGMSTSYSVKYIPAIGSGTASNYTYKFGDGSLYSGATGSQTHVYNHPGPYTTNLLVNFVGGCTDSIKNVAQSVVTASTNSCLSIFHNDTNNATVTLHYDTVGSHGTANVSSISWNYGDGNTLNQSYTVNPDSVSHTYATPGNYQVSATVTYASSLTSTSIIKVIARDTSTPPPSCYISALKDTLLGPVPNPKAFSNITVQYTDGSGDTYYSANINQLTSSNFQVTSISGYQNNINNQTTKMLHVKFNCQLKDGSGNTMTITNGDAVIAIAYK